MAPKTGYHEARGTSPERRRFLELGFIERAGEVQSRVAQEDSATGDGVDGFALAKGKTGGFAYGADFLAVRIFAAGAMR